MAHTNDRNDNNYDNKNKPKSVQKRKWREIETLKDKQKLLKQLQGLDWSDNSDYEYFAFH